MSERVSPLAVAFCRLWAAEEDQQRGKTGATAEAQRAMMANDLRAVFNGTCDLASKDVFTRQPQRPASRRTTLAVRLDACPHRGKHEHSLN